MEIILSERLHKGIEDGVFPCFAAAVGMGEDMFFREYGGNACLFPQDPLSEDDLFDMASLSKLIGTTMAFLKMWEEGKIAPENRVGEYFDNCYGKEDITLCQLLTHTSGIKAHFPLYLRSIHPGDAAEEILKEEKGYPTGSNAVYSCMGFILLGEILEKVEGMSLDKIVKKYVFAPLGMKNSCYCPKGKNCVATERELENGAIIRGVVHDENARFLGGVSGNAGIFCNLEDCITFAKMLSEKGEGYLSRKTFDIATQNYTTDFSDSRGLGFQHIGRLYGHTGFTGTSIYVDRESGRYAILLTNRVHPTRNNGKLIGFRREFHNLVFGE